MECYLSNESESILLIVDFVYCDIMKFPDEIFMTNHFILKMNNTQRGQLKVSLI